jgi:NADPH-dependent 2,4-dienoyl-CoA reductase/sulfur reductase-like enzyme
VNALSSVLVVGASLAGHATARALRLQGFDGRITLVGEEAERPYDRPPLSKEYLAGTLNEEHLRLEPKRESLAADWILGVKAVALDPRTRTVSLSDGRSISGSAVFVATGSTPRRMGPPLNGVHTLRSLADARRLRADLATGARLVVVGAGFIGAEVASTAHQLGVQVRVVETDQTPLFRPLGLEVGRAVAGLHAAHGVPLECGVAVSGLIGDDRVEGVALADGRLIPADLVLVAIGAAPAVDWLRGSGLELSNGVVCDSRGATAAPGIWAVGDCSAWYDAAIGRPYRVEHWTDSRERPALAVRALLEGHVAGAAPALPLKAPYFWSDQYGVRIQFAGHRLDSDRLVIEDGTAQEANLMATWRRDGAVVAALGLNQMRAFTRIRKGLGRVAATT